MTKPAKPKNLANGKFKDYEAFTEAVYKGIKNGEENGVWRYLDYVPDGYERRAVYLLETLTRQFYKTDAVNYYFGG